MANTIIQLKKSATPAATPSSLANGELGINYADGKLFFKAANLAIHQLNHVPNYYGTISANGTLLVADTLADVLSITQGDNIVIVGDSGTDSFSISANIVPAFTRANDAYSLAIAAFDGANSVTGGSINVSSVGPTGNANGSLWWNTDLGRLLVYYVDGSSSQWVDASPDSGSAGPTGPQGPMGPKSVTIGYPTASEDITLLYTNQQVTIGRISTILRQTGASNVAFSIKYNADRSAAGTAIKTGGMFCAGDTVANTVTAFDSATIPANNFLWLETTSITGSVQEFHLTIDFI